MTSWSNKQVRAIAASAALPSVEADALAFHGSANASVELMVTYVRSRTEGRQTVMGSGLVLSIEPIQCRPNRLKKKTEKSILRLRAAIPPLSRQLDPPRRRFRAAFSRMAYLAIRSNPHDMKCHTVCVEPILNLGGLVSAVIHKSGSQ
jgi:hypothetical protein